MHLLYSLLRDEAAVHGGAAGRCAVHVIDQLVEGLRDSRMKASSVPLAKLVWHFQWCTSSSAHRQLRFRRVQTSRTYCRPHIAARRHSVVVSQVRRRGSHACTLFVRTLLGSEQSLCGAPRRQGRY